MVENHRPFITINENIARTNHNYHFIAQSTYQGTIGHDMNESKSTHLHATCVLHRPTHPNDTIL